MSVGRFFEGLLYGEQRRVEQAEALAAQQDLRHKEQFRAIGETILGFDTAPKTTGQDTQASIEKNPHGYRPLGPDDCEDYMRHIRQKLTPPQE